ncbi:MAG TPA: reverse transcriptase domain-containing protein [Solirubrobacteraceae bacterium]|nr:reverse transcriptase domain-containing protein [Solirubrobacteraceae bacterium]
MQPTDGIPSLLTGPDVATYLGTTWRLLTWWIWAYHPNKRYYEFEIERRTGGAPRVISAPIKPIKDLQRALLPMLDVAYKPRPNVHGFTRGRSPLTNAAVHRGQRWILRIDLKDFFTTINFGRVRGVFMAPPFDFPADVATVLAQVCCHRNVLPQGAPTSPAISNLVCRSLDTALRGFAKASHCHYTRYADDICISSGRTRFPEAVASVVNLSPVLSSELRRLIEENGFVINGAKTRLMRRSQRQRVTGLIVNKRVNVPREYARHLRAVLYVWEQYGEGAAREAFQRAGRGRNWPPGKTAPDFRLVVRGQLQYLGAARGYDRIYQRLAAQLAAQDESFVPTTSAVPEEGLVIFAGEGPSDPLHVEAALRALRKTAEYTELDLRKVDHRPPKNDAQLWDWLQKEKDTANSVPRVGLFDADSEFAKKIGATGWRHLGNGVVAVVLAPASWLEPSRPFCIEMLYPRNVLRLTEAAGRRVWLRDEFDESGLSRDGRHQMRYPRSRTLVVQDVYLVADEKSSVGLGKFAFGDAVWRGQAPYDNVDFAGFRPTLDRLWRAVASAQAWSAT